jgi:hypothetical protein
MQRDRVKTIIPHPIEWIVAARTNGEQFEKFAQFRYRHHAYAFAAGVKVYQTVVIEPAMSGVAR